MVNNLSDLRQAHSQGLPYVALWPVDGFDVTWHAAQLTAGKRIMPSVRLPDPDYWQAAVPQSLDSTALGIIDGANVPIVLRTNNIRDAIVAKPRNRSTDPAIAATQGAVYVIKMDDNGVPDADQEPFCDARAPLEFWANEAAAWRKTPYFKRLIQLLPNPTATFLVENNEGTRYEQINQYVVPGKLFDPPAALQPIDEIRSVSERMANWVGTDPTPTPQHLIDMVRRAMVMQYNAFYTAFDKNALTAGYGGMVLTNLLVEYPWTGSYSQALLRYDAMSPNWYVNSPQFGDFTNCRLACVTNAVPAWEQAEATNPAAWRELSVKITDGAALAGALAGKHKPITPDLWGGYCEYLLWAMQSPDHRACVLRHYEGSFTRPTARFVSLSDQPDCDKLGVPEMKSLTIGDYVLAEEAAASHICENETLREFFTQGTPVVTEIKPPTDIQQAALKWPAYPLAGTPDNRGRLLPCDANDPPENWRYVIDGQSYTGSVKVWACASKHPDGRVLVYAWTACDMGKVQITVPGIDQPVTIDLTGKSSAYAIYGPPVADWQWGMLKQ